MYPKSSNNYLVFNYELTKNEFVKINVYDMLGKIVKNLINDQQSKGKNTIIWDATNNDNKPVSAGMYIYTLQAVLFFQTEKIVFLK